MPRRQLRLVEGNGTALRNGFDRIRREMEVPYGFAPVVLEEADHAAHRPASGGVDQTELPLVTIDPAGAMDLDQAVCIEKAAYGYRVWYAIADVASFVRPGGAIDGDSRTRGETIYMPDSKVPLHPTALSEAAASLLPGQTRPAALWRIELDESGEMTEVDVRRSVVRSQARFDYGEVQKAIDTGSADGTIKLLADVGRLRLERESARGGVSLPTPEQRIVPDGDGWRLEFRGTLPAESWNAQISLLTGMAAASLMLKGGIGLLRVLPPASPERLAEIRRVALALGVAWPDGATYGEVVRALDPANSRHAAFLQESVSLLRGSGYAAFEGQAPPNAIHAAVAAPYAHVTAPLRRLVDRFASEVCLALCAGTPIPDWTREALPGLPEVVQVTGRRANGVERACVDLVEASVLHDRVGQTFDAVVVEAGEERRGGQVQLREPAVRARCHGDRLPLGETVLVRLTQADPDTRRVSFTYISRERRQETDE